MKNEANTYQNLGKNCAQADSPLYQMGNAAGGPLQAGIGQSNYQNAAAAAANSQNANCTSETAGLLSHVSSLDEVLSRLNERLENLRSLADFVSGVSLQNGAEGPKTNSLGLVDRFGERISAINLVLNAIAYEAGRLQRAILN